MAHNVEAVAVEEPRMIPLKEEQPISLPSNRLRNLFRRPRRISRRALLALAAVAVVAGLGWWIYAQQFETTDDAQIDGHLDALSARISGTVIYINPKVENNQYVEAGTLLLELDPNDYQAALDHAKGELATREGEAHSAGVNVPITQTSAFSRLRLADAARDEAIAAADAEVANLAAAKHKVQEDEAIHGRAERDRVRYQALVEKHEISRSDYDARDTEATSAAEALETDRASVSAIEKRIAAAKNLTAQREAQVQEAQTAPQQVIDARAKSQSKNGELEQARADVRTAQLNLGYTKIYAPVNGVIGRKTVELGQRIQPGQMLLAIVPVDDIWVTANFKETQLNHMRPGERVTIHVDTFPDRAFRGRVESLSAGTGSRFSLWTPLWSHFEGGYWPIRFFSVRSL